MAKTLECNIGIYKTNSRLGVKATLGSTIAAIDAVLDAAAAFEIALAHFTSPQRSAIGQGTYFDLVQFAAPLLGCLHTFRAKASAKKKELAGHPPLPKKSHLAQLCLLLRAIYEAVQEAKRTEPKQKVLHAFTLAVLEAANIPRENYHGNPSRLRKLFFFGSVTSSDLGPWVNVQLRREIEKAVRRTRIPNT
jgi:hypothetical protein